MLLLPSVLRSPLEESRRRTSAPAQAAPLPICGGMITTRVNTNDRNSKGGDNNYMHGMNLQFLPDDPPHEIDEIVEPTTRYRFNIFIEILCVVDSECSADFEARKHLNEELRIRCLKRRNYWILIYCGISR